MAEQFRLDEKGRVVRNTGGGWQVIVPGMMARAAAPTATDSPELRTAVKAVAQVANKLQAELDAEYIQAVYDRWCGPGELTATEANAIYNVATMPTDEFMGVGEFVYRECPAPSDKALVNAAGAMRNICARELGIDEPRITWMRRETPAETKAAASRRRPYHWTHSPTGIVGQAARGYTDRIWIAADLDPVRTMAIVAHEVRHCAGGDEPEAQAYQRRWESRLPQLQGAA